MSHQCIASHGTLFSIYIEFLIFVLLKEASFFIAMRQLLWKLLSALRNNRFEYLNSFFTYIFHPEWWKFTDIVHWHNIVFNCLPWIYCFLTRARIHKQFFLFICNMYKRQLSYNFSACHLLLSDILRILIYETLIFLFDFSE